VAAVGAFGLACIAVATLLFDARLGFPGAWALLPVLGTMALLLVVRHPASTWVGALLQTRALRWTGDCSYSLYLWHWPVIIFATLLFPQHGAVGTVAVIGLSLLLGWLSYRWIELPFKHGLLQGWSSRWTVAAGLAVCVVTAGAAHVGGRADVGAEQQRFLQATVWPEKEQRGCLTRYDALDQPACEFGSATPGATLLLFGDSHAMQWFMPLKAMAEQRGWRLITLTKVQCPPLDLSVNYQGKHLTYWQCDQWREKMFERIATVKPDLVLVASSSGYRVEPAQWQAGLSRALQRLQAMGVKAAYLRDTPFPGFDVPTCLARAAWRGQSADALCSYPRAAEEARSAGVVAAETAALRASGWPYLDLSDAICSRSDCETERDGMILFLDRNHITTQFALHLQPELEKRLAPLVEPRR
jgi:hypothetical protein